MKQEYHKMDSLLGALVMLSIGVGCYGTTGGKTFEGTTALTWSQRLADSEMARRGTNQGWNYETGLFTWSLLELSKEVTGTAYFDYVQAVISRLIASDGSITGYVAHTFKLDNIMAGRSVLELHQRTGEVKYQNAAKLLRNQFASQPRTSDGGFWHKQVYPQQMWLDGLYMALPFYTQYGALYGEPDVFDDVVKQFRLMDRHAYHSESQLWYHGWDATKVQVWANPTSGTSPSFWGRGIGWFAMALVDTLDYLPEDHPNRAQLLDILNRFAAGVLRHQDPGSGAWYQVVDQGNRSGNYLEASASSMFTYVLAKGINRGYLNATTYKLATMKAYAGLIRQFIRSASTAGHYDLIQICSVASLRSGNSGTFDYYISEPKVSNDLKGVGSFILAGKEIEILVTRP
jgi:unsaturated rhamnogalacturonyl hydrolase